MNKIILSTTLLSIMSLGVDALAQSRPEGRTWFQERVAAPSGALELSIGSGYTQGFGMLQDRVAMPDVATPGLGVDLGVGARLDPHWALGVVGQYYELTAERTSAARGMTAGLGATYHFSPEIRTDPWLEFGAGYRLLWENAASPGPDLLTHGFQLARARVGLDIRLADEVAIAPFVGADANLFLWQDALRSSAIRDPSVNTFVSAGVQGRFDIGGTRVGGTTLTSASVDDGN